MKVLLKDEYIGMTLNQNLLISDDFCEFCSPFTTYPVKLDFLEMKRLFLDKGSPRECVFHYKPLNVYFPFE